MSESKTHIENLILKAAKAEKASDAMQFAQAALNAANALILLSNTKQ
jgi:hypothetical protein